MTRSRVGQYALSTELTEGWEGDASEDRSDSRGVKAEQERTLASTSRAPGGSLAALATRWTESHSQGGGAESRAASQGLSEAEQALLVFRTARVQVPPHQALEERQVIHAVRGRG